MRRHPVTIKDVTLQHRLGPGLQAIYPLPVVVAKMRDEGNRTSKRPENADEKNITLDEMVKLLIKVQSSEHFLQIKSLHTKKSTAISGHLDTVIQISTFKSN